MSLGYSSSIGEVLKNIRRQYGFFRGPNSVNMKKYEEKKTYFGLEMK